MNYKQTIEYLYSQLPMFSRIGSAAYKKDLHNTIELCQSLGNPQHEFKSIHIAGTNGKGSTSHMLAAIFQEAGLKTGLYTSPHIKDFRERIRINGKMISEDFVVGFVKKTRMLTEELMPSFFELTVAMAFDYFASEKVDIAIIETGLGGRLDSTNVITPLLSVITNVSFDHMNLLGDTLQEIAKEKAGIIKLGIPVIIGESTPETLPEFLHKSAEMNAPVHLASDEYKTVSIDPARTSIGCKVMHTKTGTTDLYTLDLQGNYQAMNLCTVLSAVDALNEMEYNIPEETVKKALQQVRQLTGLRGRWEIIHHHPHIILDVAHNEDGINNVINQLRNEYPGSSIHFILGFVNDKDIKRILPLFPVEANYYFTNAHIPRAMQYDALKTLASESALTGEGYDDVNDAITAARLHAGKDDVIMVCGSFFIIAEVNEPIAP